MKDFFQPWQDGNVWRCGARTRACRRCGHRYSKDERDLTHCPACEEDRRCRTPVRPGKRCRRHGGASPGGIAASPYRHGMYSKYLPPNLVDRYHTALADDRLLQLDDRIALLDARLTEELKNLDTGGSAVLFAQASRAFANYEKYSELARKEADDSTTKAEYVAKAGEALIDARNAVRRGHRQHEVWRDIRAMLQELRALLEAQWKREKDLQDSVKIDEMLLYTGALLEAVRTHVATFVPTENVRPFLAAVQADVRRLTATDSVS